jgi:hypothetical protein
MPGLHRVVAIVAELGFAASHVPALGADSKVESAAAVLAGIGPGACWMVRDVLTPLAGSREQPHRYSLSASPLQSTPADRCHVHDRRAPDSLQRANCAAGRDSDVGQSGGILHAPADRSSDASGSGSRDAGEDRWPAAMSRAELSGLGGCGSLPPGGGVLPLVALGTSPRQGRRRQVAVVPAADPPAGPAWEGLDRISRAVQGALQDDPSGVVHGIAIATPHPRQPRESPACTRTRPWSERRGFATTMPLRRAELREAVVNACPRMSAAIRRSVPAGRQAGRRCHPTAPTPPRS